MRRAINASRPVSRVLYGRGSSPRRDGHSSGTPVAGRLEQPTRAAGPTDEALRRLNKAPRVAPIRFCSRRGLPCRRRCRPRGALLPHPFTLAFSRMALRPAIRRFAFCGAFPGVAPAGRYPAPYPYGARTFLRSLNGGRPADWLSRNIGPERRRSSIIDAGPAELRGCQAEPKPGLVYCSFIRIMGLCGRGAALPPPSWASGRRSAVSGPRG